MCRYLLSYITSQADDVASVALSCAFCAMPLDPEMCVSLCFAVGRARSSWSTRSAWQEGAEGEMIASLVGGIHKHMFA